MSTSISLDYNPQKDKPIKCPECGKGIIIPINPKSKINHGFICDKCNLKINLTADVEVE